MGGNFPDRKQPRIWPFMLSGTVAFIFVVWTLCWLVALGAPVCGSPQDHGQAFCKDKGASFHYLPWRN